MSECSEQRFIDIAPLLSGETGKIRFDRFFFEKTEENGIVADGFSVTGEVHGKEECFFVDGQIVFTAKSQCARCLKDVEEEISADFSVPVVFAENDEMTDFVLSEDNKIDIFSLGYEKLILNLPFRLLCSENCKGICSKCGKDLNLGECGCSEKEVDPRLSGLSDFFK